MEQNIDIKENYIYQLDANLLAILLLDKSSGKNIIWATDNYAERGFGYQSSDQIMVDSITHRNGSVIKPRTTKSKKEQAIRVRDKAEVFTPSWVCNNQNNLVDNAWFGRKNVFNTENGQTWITSAEKITFPEGRTWQDYVKANRMEISCGEAPYLASRYDTVTGKWIEVRDRIGILDRKIRIVNENTETEQDWMKWVIKAFQSVYGFEWQGDSLLIARENLLFSFIDYYTDRFTVPPIKEYLVKIAKILSWNLWQMDGLKYVIPNSCKPIESLQLRAFLMPKYTVARLTVCAKMLENADIACFLRCFVIRCPFGYMVGINRWDGGINMIHEKRCKVNAEKKNKEKEVLR